MVGVVGSNPIAPTNYTRDEWRGLIARSVIPESAKHLSGIQSFLKAYRMPSQVRHDGVKLLGRHWVLTQPDP